MPTKVTVNLPDETVEAVQKIAAENGITATEAFRQLLDAQAYLHNAVKKGSKVILKAADNSASEVVFSTSRGYRS
jgi:hypothetical protein